MDIPLFDGHCDTLFLLEFTGAATGSLLKNQLHIDIERHQKYFPTAQFFAVWGENEFLSGNIFERLFKRFKDEMDCCKDYAMFCKTASDSAIAAKNHKLAAFLSVEGGELVGANEAGLEKAFENGVRSVAVTWNTSNSLSGTNCTETEKGLSERGNKFIKKCNELGVIVDVSHISEAGFWDVMKISKAPVIASHSNSKFLCPHPRNLSDDQFKAIRDSGGTVGLNLYTKFLGNDANIETCIHHIEHFLSLNGEKTLAIGGDFDGCDSLPNGISGVQNMDLLYSALRGRGFSEELLNDIFYNNLMRVVREVCYM